jgi:prepilin-type N-terminal cleavage/methylation domain-containing protein
MAASTGMRRGTAPARGSCGRAAAFTLVELMVVVAVVGLLVAIVVPYMSSVFEVAYTTMCQRNLKGLADAVHVSENPDMSIPDPGSWVGTVIGRGCEEILHCVKDNVERSGVKQGLAALEDFYILQYHTSSTTSRDTSFIPSILGAGGPAVRDPQIWAWYPAGGIHDNPKGEQWPSQYLPNIKEEQAFIGVDNDSAMMITFGSTILLETWEPPPKSMGGAGHSRHWVMKGAGTPRNPLPHGQSPQDGDDADILHMFSLQYVQHDPRSPYGIKLTGEASYGMNGLLTEKKWRMGQLMLMDANETRIDVGTGNLEDVLEEVVIPRHMGQVNVVTVGGSVDSMTMLELEEELDDPRGRWRYEADSGVRYK